MRSRIAMALVLAASFSARARAEGPAGYYRTPALTGQTLIFAAEGDLWRVPLAGGLAQRITSHPGEETNPAISPDGQRVAFTASYEGPAEVYVMPMDGGAPRRLTFEGGSANVAGWTPDGKIVYGTTRWTPTLDEQVAILDPATGVATLLPLAQAHDAAYAGSGPALYFTRFPAQGSKTKRYKGGTAQSVWRWNGGRDEAVNLTGDFPGTSRAPMWWRERVYFASNRDGTMNLWSMDPAGRDVRQHTHHVGWDVASPSIGDGRIAYQCGADIWIYDIARDTDTLLPIRLATDLDQTRDRWVKAPTDYLTASHIAPDGRRVALTAYGKVFVAPVSAGRFVSAGRSPGVRYRDAKFFPDGKSILSISTETGKTELVQLPASGVGDGTRLTDDGKVLRWEGVISPDGKAIAHHDKDRELFLLDVATKRSRRIDTSPNDDFSELTFSPDGRYLVYGRVADNLFKQLVLYDRRSEVATPLTTDRYDSYAPAFSPDGRFLYFLSDRVFESLVGGPWGSRQPEPFFDRQTKIYVLPLRRDGRSPFSPPDELHPADDAKSSDKDTGGKKQDDTKKKDKKKDDGEHAHVDVVVDVAGIMTRLEEVPVPPGNFSALGVDDKRLYVLDTASGPSPKTALKSIAIDPKTTAPVTFLEDVKRYELSADRKRILVAKGDDLYVVDAGDRGPDELAKSKLDLSGWTFPVKVRDEWRQMFVEAWRLERDYFYDRSMHAVDWTGMRAKYEPLVERVTTRAELNDLLAQMVAELSALHMFVRGGDLRKGGDAIEGASLGAQLVRDERAGGERVEAIYRTDPDQPDRLSPLARPGIAVAEGDVLLAINGQPVLAEGGSAALLRNQAGKQVLLHVRHKAGAAEDVIAVPVTLERDADLRYAAWEYGRRLKVEEWSHGKIGYVHLRAMNAGNATEWYREFYPVFDRPGLIVDVRYNRGGNIDSWILEKLLRKAWFYWKPRVGAPYWNMQYAFRGHAVVLCNYRTASDGEAFSEGFRRLGLGKVIGTRTWGGEIWLSSSNVLADKGIATAAENGVYGPEGAWLIEGHGVEPDLVVDNLPRATFDGEDAQLRAAVDELLRRIAAEPRTVPTAPAYPDKSR